MSTSRDKIIETASNLDLAVLSGTGSALDKWRDLRVQLDGDAVLVIRFDRADRVREAAVEHEDGARTAIRPANVEILRDEMRAAFSRKTETVRIETDRRVAKAKLAAELSSIPLCEIDDDDAVGRVEPAGDIFDTLEASYVARDGFGTRDEYVSPRAQAAELPRKRDELTVSATPGTGDRGPWHFADAAGKIPILSDEGLRMFGRAVSIEPGTQMQKVDGLTSVLLGMFATREERDELLTFAHNRGHRVAGSTSTTAARFLALEALMSAAIADATPAEPLPSRAALLLDEQVTGFCPACGHPATAVDPLVAVPAGKGYGATRIHRSHTTDTDSGFFGLATEQIARRNALEEDLRRVMPNVPVVTTDPPYRIVGPMRVRAVRETIEVARWATKLGGFTPICSLTREEADALHTALGRELYG